MDEVEEVDELGPVDWIVVGEVGELRTYESELAMLLSGDRRDDRRDRR